eukprot:CAMPEP_0113908956 /NCGR_PEP_ID=MMETSP0780_2-20120614/26509_1 /TAXON_ID=652834 /ORGANISM="Palpitomonas bilix" /LENGTH=84 /DNA_ID=CAMNT_0000904561 /DNA_START=1 /DNA_END=255 /DNA_ORIENTATION=+ /assembly_acc=CAM_ASM_000599
MLEAHTQSITAIRQVMGGRYIATSSLDGALRLWDTSTGDERASLLVRSKITSLDCAEDGSSFLVGCANGDVLVLKLMGRDVTLS